MGGVGYDALRKALGQSLEMDAVAKVGVMIGNSKGSWSSIRPIGSFFS
jgi:hypothetical protein